MKNIRFYIAVTVLLTQIACGTLNDKQRKATDTALNELHKLSAASEVGISKSEYSKMLISAQAATNEATSALPDGELKNELADTMQSYIDAKTIWFIMKDDTYIFTCTTKPDFSNTTDIQKSILNVACNPESGELAIKYKLPIRNLITNELAEPSGVVKKDEALSIIWKSAKEKLDSTTKLAN